VQGNELFRPLRLIVLAFRYDLLTPRHISALRTSHAHIALGCLRLLRNNCVRFPTLASASTIDRQGRARNTMPDSLHVRTTQETDLLPLAKAQRPSTASTSASSSEAVREYILHLDGLRAVALAGVLAFHFDVACAPGGYVGVDCFLALSGYLMTRNIMHAVFCNAFSLSAFYRSRVWRLLPSVVSTCTVATGLAFLTFPPLYAVELAESSIAAVFSGSNLYFWSKGNYFDIGSSVKPLLHTWSLSLEEQFYLVYPPLLVCLASISKSSRHPSCARPCDVGRVVATLTALSFIFCVYVERIYPKFAFYFLPSRVFQFGIGGLAHFYEKRIQNVCFPRHNFVSVVAICVTALSFACLGADSPVSHGLPATFAFGALISTPQSFISRKILSSRPFVWIGLLTYSAYLVHWPLVVFTRHTLSTQRTSALSLVSLTIVTLILAITLQRCVENPLRKCRNTPGLLAAVIILLCAACSSMNSSGWKWRIAGAEHRSYVALLDVASAPIYNRASGYYKVTEKVMFDARKNHLRVIDGYATGAAGAGRHYDRVPDDIGAVLVGSSYAAHLVGGISVIVNQSKSHFPVLSLAVPGCPYVPKHGYVPSELVAERIRELKKPCVSLNKKRRALMSRLPDNTTVFIVDSFLGNSVARAQAMANSVTKMGLSPVVIGPFPLIDQSFSYVYKCVDFTQLPVKFVFDLLGLSRECPTSSLPHPRTLREDAILKKFSRASGAFAYISLFDVLCPNAYKSGLCRHTMKNDALLYAHDNYHLSFNGSFAVGDQLASALLPFME
jgi:peptidoglycan/LPS O-acetylase OafA/YrhL